MPKARHILNAEERFHGAGRILLIWFNDCPKTLCDVIAVRLLPIAVLQPILSHLLSVSCHLLPHTSDHFRSKTTERLCTRARYCDVECAAVLPHFLFWLSARSGSVFRQLRDNARKSWALERAD